jgi:hypothetical protein
MPAFPRLFALLLPAALCALRPAAAAAPDPARYNVVWNTSTPGAPMTDAMPTGNGRTVVLAWAEPALGGLSFYVRSPLALALDTQVYTVAKVSLALAPNPLSMDDYARYVSMNDRFHALILEASGNRALQRAVAMNDKLPFASASAMLPMQGSMVKDRDWMLYAHRQHHMLLDAMRRGEGARATALRRALLLSGGAALIGLAGVRCGGARLLQGGVRRA